mgnify:CR=1 FL=1
MLLGSVYAWFTVIQDIQLFIVYYGSLFTWGGKLLPHPVQTPCLYGAFGFVVGFIWLISIRNKKGEELLRQVKYFVFFLVAGNIYAWGNFGWLAYRFFSAPPGQRVSCSGLPTDNIFATPCFIGSSIFLTALVISLLWYKSLLSKHNNIDGKDN